MACQPNTRAGETKNPHVLGVTWCTCPAAVGRRKAGVCTDPSSVPHRAWPSLPAEHTAQHTRRTARRQSQESGSRFSSDNFSSSFAPKNGAFASAIPVSALAAAALCRYAALTPRLQNLAENTVENVEMCVCLCVCEVVHGTNTFCLFSTQAAMLSSAVRTCLRRPFAAAPSGMRTMCSALDEEAQALLNSEREAME